MPTPKRSAVITSDPPTTKKQKPVFDLPTSLNWDAWPDVLLPEEAALLLRCDDDLIREILTEQRLQIKAGNPPANPFPAWRRGDSVRNSRIRIPKAALHAWVMREAGNKS